MAWSEFEQHRFNAVLRRFCEEHTSPEIRHKLSYEFQLNAAQQSVEICEVRPHFQQPEIKIHSPVARFSFVKTSKQWKLYWMRGNGKWFRYETDAPMASIEDVLSVINTDQYGCFFG